MNTSPLLARLGLAAVLLAPLSSVGSLNEDTANELKLTKFVEPEFPDAARLAGVAEGHVTLALSRDAAGVPGDILVLTATDPRFAAPALQAVRQWRFAPSSNPADLAARNVRLGFRLTGVILMFPNGKNYREEEEAETDNLHMRAPVRVASVQSLARAPKALRQSMPEYPAELAPQGLNGSAKVRFYVDQEGRVRLPEVIEASAPEFAAAALAAVAKWRYEPPREGGRAIVASDNWAFQFHGVN